MIVSINGSNRATVPSSTGFETFAAEWAIAADPIPASFENTARLIPMMSTPRNPPKAASGWNAWLIINWKADGIEPRLENKMNKQAKKWISQRIEKIPSLSSNQDFGCGVIFGELLSFGYRFERDRVSLMINLRKASDNQAEPTP